MSGKGRGRGRGRGKRILVTSDRTDILQESQDKPIAKKTTKKKQFPVVAVVGPDGIEGNLIPETKRPLIVHLPIQSKDVLMNDMPIMYDPHPPSDAQPYDSNADNPFYEGVEQIETTNIIVNKSEEHNKQEENKIESLQNLNKSENIISPQVDFYNIKTTFLVKFKDYSDIKKIPETSEAACFWCCHTFNNCPVVLPIRDTGAYLEVTGNFCCPECAMAYLFDIRQDSHTRWEQLALLHRVYAEICGGKIHPAPPRSSLKLFGGHFSIQEYRHLIHSHKVRVDIHLPPMVSILATMDTKPIDFYDASLTKGVTETVKERLQKAEEILRLRRTKPLKAWESTLDACINLKIRTNV